MTRKEKIYKYICHEGYKPLTKQELCITLDVPKSDYGAFYAIIGELLAEGKLAQNKKGRIRKAAAQKAVYGTLRLMKSGNAFVVPLEADEDIDPERLPEGDVFVDRKNLGFALDGDTVAVKVISSEKTARRKSREGIVTKVVRRAADELAGTLRKQDGRLIFIPDGTPNMKASLTRDSEPAKDAQKAIAKIVRYPDKDHTMKVRITEILGTEDDLSTLTTCIVRESKIPEQFSPAAMRQAQATDSVVLPAETKGRTDFRSDNVITIDGEDARDLDDAVCVKKQADGSYLLYVHIADVSHYVGENTAIDLDAYERATSVYLPGRVIPMLPRELSNGICSLNPDVDRLTMSATMHISAQGDVIDHKIEEGLIRSKRRMTYTDVTAILEGDAALALKYSDIADDLKTMKELALLLKTRRSARGAIDFNFPEPKIVLDKDGNVYDIKAYPTGIANEIIEQFMLLTNETVAKHAEDNGLPFVYRVHERPSEEKITTLQKCLNIFGIPFTPPDAAAIKPADIQKIVTSIKGTPQEAPIGVLCLRSMMKARYSPENLGHFGLASTDYCHFTSPIRRYPDLVIHRILKESIHKGITQKRETYLKGFVDSAATQSSEAEVRATDAERAADKLYECAYMEQFVGEEFDAVISSVTDFGIFVELPSSIEGMIPMTELKDDFYVFEEDFLRLRGERTAKTFTLGDEIRVQLLRTDVRLRRIDFTVAGMAYRNQTPSSKKHSYEKEKKKKQGQKKQFRSYVKKKTKKKR